MSKKVETALVWIKQILEDNQVPYQIVGGLAARIHGGTRPVADIDLYIPRESAEQLMPHVQAWFSKPLTHYREGGWDLEYCQLIYQNQKIEIGLSPGTQIQDGKTGQWIELTTDFASSEMGEYQGISVPVIPVADLLAYKILLDREVDRIDIRELSNSRIPG